MTLEDLYRLLRSGHVQAQGIVDTLEEPLLVVDQALRVVNGNRAFFEKFAVDRDDTVGKGLFDLGGGQWDIPELRRLLGEVLPKATAIVGYEVDAEFPSIGRHTMLVSARRLIHPDNNSTQILVTFEDVTAQRGVDAAKDILLAEARHRIRNLLAVVQALASQAEVEGRSARDYRDAFLARFEAVVHAEDLSLASRAGTDLGALVDQAVARAGAGQCRLDPGPAVALRSDQVLPLGMILHELVTNALKYGALSTPEGVLDLSWGVTEDGGRRTLSLHWDEKNGPPVASPSHTGFGTRLIRFSAERSLQGTAELSFEPTGLRVSVTVPLD